MEHPVYFENFGPKYEVKDYPHRMTVQNEIIQILIFHCFPAALTARTSKSYEF